MKEQIDGNKKEERSQKLIKLSVKNEKEYNQSFIGKEVEVLWDEKKEGIYKGHTKNYIQAYYKETESKKTKELENKIEKVKCIGEEKEHIIVTL